jgi:hypothetical protein
MALLAAAALTITTAAHADIVLLNPGPPINSFVDLGAQGFGNAPRLLTLQTNTVETGNVTPVDAVHNDAISGADKSTTPTIAQAGWTSGATVGIGFNSDQTGQTGVTMQSLTLTIYSGTTAVGSFNLAPVPLQFAASDLKLEPGNGNAVFDFKLDAAQQAQFDAILAQSGSAAFFIGLGAQLGCPAASATCQPSNDGPDTFLAFAQAGQQVVPLPSAMWLFGSGLAGLIALSRKRKAA